MPDDLKDVEACFSPGVSNFKDFEDNLADTYGIKSHMCDFSSDLSLFKTPLRNGLQTFEKKWLASKQAENSITLEDWVKEKCPQSQADLILQMDIEGAEYEILPLIHSSLFLRFRIIIIELHRLGVLQRPHSANEILRPTLEKLSSTHTCVHAHPNNCCGQFIHEETGMNIPRVAEFTFLRNDRFTSVRYHAPQLPHPLDIVNALHKEPIHLNSSWLENREQSIDSKIKIHRDFIDHYTLIKGKQQELGRSSQKTT